MLLSSNYNRYESYFHEQAFQKMKEFMKKKEIEFDDENKLKDDFNNGKLQIHHINNNGHHNTPTYWDENGKMIEGNLIALPDSVHKEIESVKDFL